MPQSRKSKLPDDLAAALGQAVATYAILESELHSIVHSLLGADQRVGQIVTTEQRSFKGLLNLASALCRYKLGDGRADELNAILQRAERAEKRRNDLLHSVWAAGNTKDESTRIKAVLRRKSGWVFNAELITAAQLEEDEEEFGQAAHAALRFHMSIMGVDLPE